MKKILLTTFAAILAIVPVLAGTFSNDYKLSGFTGIRASSFFNIAYFLSYTARSFFHKNKRGFPY